VIDDITDLYVAYVMDFGGIITTLWNIKTW